MKKILFFIFAIFGAFLIFFLLSIYVLTDATTSLSETAYEEANETGDFIKYLQLSEDYIKKIDMESLPDHTSFYQTVNYNYTDKIYNYRYFIFIRLPEGVSLIDDPNNENKIPHLKVYLNNEEIYYSGDDEAVMGSDDYATNKMDFSKIRNFFFSFPLKNNGNYRVDLLTNSGTLFESFTFDHQEEEITQTLTREQFDEIFKAKTDYTEKMTAEEFNNLLDQHTRNYIVWLGMSGYCLLVVGLWFLFFGRVLMRFKKNVETSKEFE